MRIVTRGDFDSLISTVLLSIVHQIDDLLLTRPEVLDTSAIQDTDIIVNLPYISGCGYWFDHHINEAESAKKLKFKGSFKISPSCSRVIFDYYNTHTELKAFASIINIADKIDSAQFSIEDIKNPHGWYLIDRTLSAFDPQGRLGDFKEYFEKLVEWIKTDSFTEILLSDEVQSRLEFVRSEHKIFIEALKECSRIDKNVIITDSRKMRFFPNGNRFLIYTLYPSQNVSVSIFNKRDSEYSVIFCGHNIFNRTCQTDINELLKKFNGSGRISAGTCIVPKANANAAFEQIIEELKV